MGKYNELTDEETGEPAHNNPVNAQKKFKVSKWFRARLVRINKRAAKCLLPLPLVCVFAIAWVFTIYQEYSIITDIKGGKDSKCDHYMLCDYEIPTNDTCLIKYVDDANALNTCYFAITDSFTRGDCMSLSDDCIKPYGNHTGCPVPECDYSFAGSISALVLIFPLSAIITCCGIAIGVNYCKEILYSNILRDSSADVIEINDM